MSKIAKRVISIPQNVKINFQKGAVFAEGPLGKSEELFIPQEMEITNNEGKILTKSENNSLAGTYNSLIYNMIKGVTEGYEDILEVKGIGYKVLLKGKELEFTLGFSHPIKTAIPSNLEITCPNNNQIIIQGISKEEVGLFASKIESLRRPNPYKLKGIYRENAIVKLKSGKKST